MTVHSDAPFALIPLCLAAWIAAGCLNTYASTEGVGAMQASDFPADYKLKMIRAYPVIAQMDADEEFFATAAERDAAFGRILANRNLRRTHEMFLAEHAYTDGPVDA